VRDLVRIAPTTSAHSGGKCLERIKTLLSFLLFVHVILSERGIGLLISLRIKRAPNMALGKSAVVLQYMPSPRPQRSRGPSAYREGPGIEEGAKRAMMPKGILRQLGCFSLVFFGFSH